MLTFDCWRFLWFLLVTSLIAPHFELWPTFFDRYLAFWSTNHLIIFFVHNLLFKVLLDAKFSVPGSDVESIHVNQECVQGKGDYILTRRAQQATAWCSTHACFGLHIIFSTLVLSYISWNFNFLTPNIDSSADYIIIHQWHIVRVINISRYLFRISVTWGRFIYWYAVLAKSKVAS